MVEAAESAEDKERPRRVADEALANSSPDIHHGFMRLIHRLFAADNPVKVGSGAILSALLMLFVVGLPALNGTTILIDKVGERDSAERNFQLEMFKLQTDVELKKLEMTNLGDGAAKTLNEISHKLDQQAEQIKAQGEQMTAQGKQIERLAVSVSGLESRQQGSARRIESLAQAQQQLQGTASAGARPR